MLSFQLENFPTSAIPRTFEFSPRSQRSRYSSRIDNSDLFDKYQHNTQHAKSTKSFPRRSSFSATFGDQISRIAEVRKVLKAVAWVLRITRSKINLCDLLKRRHRSHSSDSKRLNLLEKRISKIKNCLCPQIAQAAVKPLRRKGNSLEKHNNLPWSIVELFLVHRSGLL